MSGVPYDLETYFYLFFAPTRHTLHIEITPSISRRSRRRSFSQRDSKAHLCDSTTFTRVCARLYQAEGPTRQGGGVTHLILPLTCSRSSGTTHRSFIALYLPCSFRFLFVHLDFDSTQLFSSIDTLQHITRSQPFQSSFIDLQYIQLFDRFFIMPVKWTPETDFKVLLYVVKHLDLKLEKEVFEAIANILGDGANANGVGLVPWLFD